MPKTRPKYKKGDVLIKTSPKGISNIYEIWKFDRKGDMVHLYSPKSGVKIGVFTSQEVENSGYKHVKLEDRENEGI